MLQTDYAKSQDDLAILINVEVYEKELVCELAWFHHVLTSPFKVTSSDEIGYMLELPDTMGERHTPVTLLGDVHLKRI